MARKKEPKEVLIAVRKQPCLACPSGTQVLPTEADHISTRGSGGKNTIENVWPLCQLHHRIRHNKGLGFMIQNFPGCRGWLLAAGRSDVFDRCGVKVW